MTIHRRFTTVVVPLALLASVCSTYAHTWRVELDGTGDFTIIQDAIDAAAEGDTILVGAGQFETIRPIPDWDGFNATMAIQKGGLVVEGQGVGTTIIGANDLDWHYRSIVVNSWATGNGFTLRNATVIGGYNGLHYERDQLLVEDCEFTGSTNGIVTFATWGAVIRNCSFHDMEGGGVSSYDADDGSSDIRVAECRFDRVDYGINFAWTSNADAIECEFTNVGMGIQYHDLASGRIADCRISGIPDNEYGVAVGVGRYSNVDISNSVLDWSMTSTYRALDISESTVTGTGNIIRGGGVTSIHISSHFDASDFTGNEIYKADQYCLEAVHFTDSTYDPLLHLDMTGNYWGTSDPDSIAAWIDDHHDHHPQDPQHWVIVDFVPFLEVPVPVEPTSLSDVRGLFR